MDISAAKAALSHLDIDDNPAAIRAKSRDFFWYSPVLKDRLDHVSADFAVMPRDQDEVIEILRICHAHDVPVTMRGSGTGNYGQAMPLAGGCIMHMQNMAKVLDIGPGRVTAQPGIVIRELDRITREDSGQELRMMPSTAGTATIGGFIC
ncbi:MAG: FAD-binding oxidoreductase, partial [Paracoccus sp.]|nr:FAD-binding oxidoreductase [Paracoccus sp. (in: a-proteobacteria)]